MGAVLTHIGALITHKAVDALSFAIRDHKVLGMHVKISWCITQGTQVVTVKCACTEQVLPLTTRALSTLRVGVGCACLYVPEAHVRMLWGRHVSVGRRGLAAALLERSGRVAWLLPLMA